MNLEPMPWTHLRTIAEARADHRQRPGDIGID
jgi:hypothetical protein